MRFSEKWRSLLSYAGFDDFVVYRPKHPVASSLLSIMNPQLYIVFSIPFYEGGDAVFDGGLGFIVDFCF